MHQLGLNSRESRRHKKTKSDVKLFLILLSKQNMHLAILLDLVAKLSITIQFARNAQKCFPREVQTDNVVRRPHLM